MASLDVGFDHVGDHNVSGVLAVNGHVDDGAHAVAVDVGHSQAVHELVVAGGHRDVHPPTAMTPSPLISWISETRVRSISLP